MKAIVLGYYGAKNHGDDMMLLYLLRWLKLQNIEASVVSENVEDTQSRFDVDAVLNTPLLGQWGWFNSYFRGYAYRLAKAIWRNDILVVGGGDIIRDDKGWKVFWYTMEKIILALLMRKKVILVNVGVGVPVKRISRTFLKWALKRCEKIVIRDERSLNLCHELGCADTTILIDDIVFNLPNILNQKQVEAIEQPKNKSQYVVVSIRGNPNVGRRYSLGISEIKNLSKGLDYLVDKHGFNILFVPFQKEIDDGEAAIVNTVFDLMKYKDKATFCKWTSDLEKILDIYKGARFVVAMRLHAAVLAVAYNKNCVLMPYDIKLTELAQQVGLTNLLYSDDLTSYEKVIESLETAINEKPEYRLQPDILKDIKLASL